MKLKHFILALVAMLSCFTFTANAQNVAKVGNTEYATIDAAIAAWKNGTTLTLLDNVTLSDVVTLKSTEHHILDLGTFTMTAASGKNAIVIKACGTGSAERTAITINADAKNPGGINAGSKCVVYYKYADGGISTEDRPIIKINGGVFTGSTSSWGTAGIYTIGTAARKCATLNIAGGTFNCSINGSGKSKLIISGGVFNYSVGSQGDSTALRLISGGTFKTFGFMTADSNNTKFWFGTSMGNSNVGVHVDDNGCIVVGGAVVTEAGDKFEASSTNYSGANSLLQYSSAKDNGLYYTNVEEAFADNNTASGMVTVYADEIDMADISYKGTIVVPEGNDITITNAPSTLKVQLSDGTVLTPDTNGNVTTIQPVAKIGEQSYETFAEALAATKTMTGDVIVEIYDKVTFNQPLIGNYTSINFVGKEADAEMYLDVQGYTTATGKEVTFTDLKLSKSVGGHIANAGFMNVAFGIYDVKKVSYNNCTFLNGACASSGEVTFNGCTFYRSHDRYGLWAYGAPSVTVDGCTFADIRGIKLWDEGKQKLGALTVKNTDFSAVTDKPAIVLTSGKSVVLAGNTYNADKGTFELDLDGNPNGTPVTSDVAPVCVNDNGACGVLVDGKIYTTVAQAAEVATSGSTVTLLHNSAETVALPMGVTLNKNNFEAAGVTVAVPVAKIGDVEYATLAAAVEAAQAGAEIVVVANVADVTIDITKNLTISGAATLNNVGINANGADVLTVKGLTFTGNSWINSGTAEALTVSGIAATVAPNNKSYTNSRSAFISLGRSEGQELALTVENSNITVEAAGADAILGWAAITKATITGNVIKGSDNGYFAGADAIKFMAIADGAKFVVNNNEIYSNYNGIVFAQNTTRDNAYSVSADANKFYGSNADHIWIEITGGNTVHATFNATSANTVNGNAFTVTDIKYRSGVIKSWSSYAGVDVVTDSNGKVIGGTLASYSNKECIAEGYEIGTNGAVGKASVAEVNGTKYASFAEAAANAQADSEIKLLANIDGDITVPANVTLNGNGFAVSGVITADGTITFAGVTKAGNFGVKNVNTVVNIPAGASLQLTGTSRMVIGHGCTFNITGTIADAKTANVADVTPSLVIPGASFSGSAGVKFNVTNAYISVPSSYCSTSKTASGTFDFNITNSIWESAGKLAFEEQSVNAKVDFALVNSVLTTGSHLVFGTASGEEGVVIDNSLVNEGTSRQLENCGKMTIKNGSVVNGAVATSSNAKNPGTVIVENATYAVTGEFSGSDLGTGTLIIKKGANVSVGSIKAGANVKVDAEGMAAGDEINFTANLSQFTGTLSVINNDNLNAKVVNGKIVLVERTLAGEGTEASPYLINNIADLKIFRNKVNAGDNYSGKFVKLNADIDLNNEQWEPIGYMGKNFVGNFDGGNFTISNLKVTKELTNAAENNGVGLFGRLDSPATIKNLTIKNATVTGSLYVGAVVGYAYTGKAIENVTVKGDIAINAYWYAGVIGGNGYMNLVNNCHVIGNDGSYIKGNNGSYIGGIWGFRGEGANKITNCTVTNLSIEGVDRVGGISGMAHYGNTISDCAVKNTAVKATDAKATTVGLIAGACQGTTDEPSIITGSTVENVKVTVADSEVVASLYGTNINGTTPVTNYVAKIGANYYESFEAAITAAQAGQTVSILKAGTYALKVKDGITITGAVAGVEFANIGAFGCNGANVTFNNVTFTYAENSTYKGLQHSGNLVYNNCTFNGQVFLYGESETFNKCTFNTTDSNNYNVWTYGAKNVAFNECTFNSAGKSVLIYNESASVTNNVTVTKSTFKASQAVEGKAAIEMDSSLSGAINLTIDSETTAEGFAAGNVSGNSLWNNKKGNKDVANNDITVKVGDETVLAPAPIVVYYQDGTNEVFYDMLKAVPYTSNYPKLEGATIKLLADVAASGLRFMENNMVFDLNGHTYTITAGTGSQGTNTSGFQIRPEVTTDVTFKNGTIKVAEGAPVVYMFNNYATNFILEDVTVDCANMAWSYGNSCYVVVSRGNATTTGARNVEFKGNTTIANFNSIVAGTAYSIDGTMTVGENVECGGSFKLAAGATLTAKEGLNVETVDGYILAYNNGVYATISTTANVATKAELQAALANDNIKTIVLTADIDYGTTQLAITKAITLDLGGYTLTTANAYGGMSIKNNPTVKNGTIVHASNTAAIKVWNATAFEDLVIDVQGKGDANKIIGGIVLQSGSTTKVGSIKNVTIKGAALTNGIETYNCGDATENVIGAMENVTIDAQGTGLLISAPCGTATNCDIKGGVTGIELWIKGNYSATLALVDSDVKGGEKPVYVHDEFSTNPDIQNNGTLALTADEATTFTSESGALAAVNIARAENADRTVVDKLIENAIVCVGDVYFDDFAKAWAAVKAGQTVTLLADLEATSVIEIGKSMTINGNGHKVTSSATRVFRVTTANTEVTLNDVKMVSTAVRVGTNDVRGISIDIVDNVKLTLNNSSVDFTHASATDWSYAVNVTGGNSHVVTVNGGTYEGANVINVRGTENTVVVKDATLTSLYPNNDVYYGACIWVLQNQGSSVEATGNTFNGSNTMVFNVGTGTTVTESNNTDNTTMCVAKIGNEYYTSLAAAFAVGGEVKVLQNIVLSETATVPADKTIVLDLNGKTVSMAYAEDATANHTMISNMGNLTIQSSVEGGKLSYTYTGKDLGTTYAANTVTSEPGSVLTVKSGTIENLTYDKSVIAYAIDARTNGGSGDVTINIEGGVITSQRQAVRVFANSTTNTGALNISGGEFTGRVIVQNASAKANKAALNITGGTFNANAYKTDVLYVGGSNSATIDINATVSGGTFNGDITETHVKGFISGGTFKANTDATLLAADFMFGTASNGYCSVVQESGVAEKGTWGGIDWTLTNGGTLTIAPTAGTPVADKNAPTKRTYEVGEWREAVIYKSNGSASAIGGYPYDVKKVKKLIIEEGVTKIGSFTAQFPNLTGEVVIPSTVTYIGQEAFYAGSTNTTQNISKITFAAGGTAPLCIANGAFKSVEIEEIAFPGDREYIHIHHWAFGGSPNLKRAYIPANVTKSWGGEHVDYFDNFNSQTNPSWTNSGSIFTGCKAMETITFENKEVRDLFFANNRQATAEDYIVAAANLVAYNTIEKAIAALEDGDDLFLVKSVTLKDTWTIPAGMNLTLNLNGKTLSQSKACTASYEMINNKGNLTITGNGKLSFKDTSAGDPSFGWGSYTVRNEGNLVVENGTIEHLGAQKFATHMICAIFQYSGSTTINGGTISTPNYRSARLWKGDMTINGGTFDGQVWVQAVDNSAKLTINGGTFEPNGNDASAVFVSNADKNVALAVTDGTFKGKVGCSDATKLAGAITGGKFTETAKNGTNAALLATGLTFGEADANGYYAVEDDPATHYIATLDELKAFRDDVNDGVNFYEGVTVYLAADIDMDGENWVGIGSATKDHGFMGNFDGQGYKIKNLTITNPALDSDGYAYAGLFGVTEGTDKNNQNTIKNLTIENVTITTTGHIAAAAIAYPYYTIVDNVKVCGDIKIQGGDYTAGVLAYTRRCVNASNLSIVGNDGSFVKGNQVVGGVISDIQMNGGLVADYSNFSAEGLTVTGAKNVGGISGIIATQTLDGATVKNVTLDSNDAASAGIVSGALGGTSTISNVTFENVTGATALLGATYDGKAIEAKIGNTYYATLEKALAAQGEATVELLVPFVVAADETVVLNLNGKTVVATDNATGSYAMITNRGNLTIEGEGAIKLTATNNRGWNAYSSVISNTVGGKLTVNGGTIEHLGGTDMAYAIDNLTNGKGTYAETVINGGLVKSPYRAVRMFLNGVEAQNILTVNGGTIEGANKSIWMQDPSKNANTGTLTVGNNASLKGDVYLFVTAGSTAWPVEVAIANAAFVTGTVVTGNVPAQYVVTNVNGVWSKVSAVAEINGVGYATFAKALAAAEAGATITLLADVTEDVTTTKAVTIDGAGKTYTGKMTVKADATIKNVNFDGKGYNGYAVETRGANYLTIEDCTAKNYGYGFVQTASGTVLTTVKNVTVSNMNYGVKVDYSNAVVLENVDITVGVAALLNSNYGEKTITIKNSKLNILGTWVRNNTIKTTYVFEGDNTVGKFMTEDTIDNFKLTVGATLTAPAGKTVTTDVEGYSVKYEDGKYFLKGHVAKIGDNGYATLAEALAAANASDEITFIAGITEDVTLSKAVTIDGAGNTYTGAMTLKADATFKNVNFDGKGFNGYAITTRGANYLTIEDCTAKNYGYGFVQLASGTALTTVKNVTVSNMNYGVKVDYSNAVVLENVDITAGVAALLNSNYGEKTITIKNSKLNILGTWKRNETIKTTYVFEGANTVGQFITDAAIDNFTLDHDATLTAPEGLTVVPAESDCPGAEYESVVYENGVYKVECSYIDELTIVDGDYTEFENQNVKTVGTLTYERDMTNYVGKWQPLYVPFEIPVSKLTELGYQVAIFYDVHFDLTDEGDLDLTSAPDLHILKITSGTLKANYPYVIKASADHPQLSLELSDAKLYSTAKSEMNSVESGSTITRFIFAGTYTKATPAGLTGDVNIPCYAINTNGNFQKMGTAANLPAFRVYMSIVAKDGSYVILAENAAESIRMRVIGEEAEDGTTIIYDVEMDEVESVDYIFDLQGRRVLEPQKGNLYIINGKKVIF